MTNTLIGLVRYCLYAGTSPECAGIKARAARKPRVGLCGEALNPFVGAEITADRPDFVEWRGNVIIKCAPASSRATDKTLALVGAHMDVVPAKSKG